MPDQVRHDGRTLDCRDGNNKVLEKTLVVQDAVNKIIWNVKDRNEVIQKSCKYFDSLYHGAGRHNTSHSECAGFDNPELISIARNMSLILLQLFHRFLQVV